MECFLLHYRNLIEFVGKEQGHVHKTDLHLSNLWKKIQRKLPADLAQLHTEGRKLWEKYERVDDRISRFLQHCTTLRTEFKEWEVGTMYNELEPLLQKIEIWLAPRDCEGGSWDSDVDCIAAHRWQRLIHVTQIDFLSDECGTLCGSLARRNSVVLRSWRVSTRDPYPARHKFVAVSGTSSKANRTSDDSGK